MIKQLVEIQLYNSIWKILKMRMAFRCILVFRAVLGGKYPTLSRASNRCYCYRYKVSLGEQCGILSSVGMWGARAHYCS